MAGALKMRIKKGDRVEVICGDDKKKIGEVLKTFPKKMLVLVSGVRLVSVKNKNRASDAPSYSVKERPIHCSNVRLVL